MITQPPKTALKAILGAMLFVSFAITSCNNDKKTETTKTETVSPAPTTIDTTGKGPMDTGATKPVKELN